MPQFDWTAAQAELRQRYALSSSKIGGLFGKIHQIPIHVFPLGENGQQTIALLMNLASAEASRLAGESLLDAGPLQAAGCANPSCIQAADNTLLVKLPQARISDLGPRQMAKLVNEVIAVVAGIPEVKTELAAGTRVAIVNQQPLLLNSGEINEIREAGQAINQAYAQEPANYPLGLLWGLAGVIVGSVVWGSMGAFFHLQAWIVAIGAGWLIGYLVLKGAGKITLAVQAMIFLLTITVVLLGEVLDVTFLIMREGGPFAPVIAARLYFQNLDQVGGNFMFALIGGVIGAYGACRMAARPNFIPEIEVDDSDVNTPVSASETGTTRMVDSED